MKINNQENSVNSKFISGPNAQNKKIESIIEYGQTKINKINKKIIENDLKLESMESHSDYEYRDLLRESNEAEKEHKKDLKLFVDLLCKYKETAR
jgi:bacterioferritin (cytochrome b1)